jgi:hypothetical protein
LVPLNSGERAAMRGIRSRAGLPPIWSVDIFYRAQLMAGALMAIAFNLFLDGFTAGGTAQ